MLVDYHVHFRNADEEIAHPVDAVERFVDVARSPGIGETGPTEHGYYFSCMRSLRDVAYPVDRCEYGLDEVGLEQAWLAYVDELATAARAGLLDVLAHRDLVDAHVPAVLGEDFDLALARDAGYDTVTVVDGRVARREPLG